MSTDKNILREDINKVTTSWLKKLATRAKAIQDLHAAALITHTEFTDGMNALRELLHSEMLTGTRVKNDE